MRSSFGAPSEPLFGQRRVEKCTTFSHSVWPPRELVLRVLESEVENVKRDPRRREAEREFKVWRKQSLPMSQVKTASEIAQSVIQDPTIM